MFVDFIGTPKGWPFGDYVSARLQERTCRNVLDLRMRGLLLEQAESPEQRAVAIEAAAQGIRDTLDWRQKRKFMTPQQLNAWEPYVSPFLGRMLTTMRFGLCVQIGKVLQSLHKLRHNKLLSLL
jgi:hypothetical protein